jgi:hypothetical protein
MAMVRPAALEHDLESLLFGKKALAWYRIKHQELTDACSTALFQQTFSDLGPTLQDGGERITSPAELLSAGQYYQLLESLSRYED